MAASGASFKIDTPAIDGKEGKIAAFIAGDIDDDLTSVPGIGPATVAALLKADVKTTRQLIGKFFMLTTRDDDGKMAADSFVRWLSEAGVLGQWYNIITYSVGGKAESMAPGTFTMTR